MEELLSSSKLISNQDYFLRAKQIIPGGVNSPVRAFKSVGGNPLFIQKAKGAWMYDVEGKAYLDLINSWGPMILGHAHEEIIAAAQNAMQNSFSFGAPCPGELELAERICRMVPSIEMVRLVNSGTEATMSAIRLARGFTQREKILKFEGCYHGHGDSFLIAAGSGALTTGVPDSKGITEGTAKDTLTARFNDLEAVEKIVNANAQEIAAIIVEPVAGNMGLVLPKSGFLEGLRSLCNEHNIVLIFDEVMTGFRLAKGGAQELLGIKPDLSTLGKIIGGGMPVGAYGGRKEIMEFISPLGPVYQAGTLSGNPVAMASGNAMLNMLENEPSIYSKLNETTQHLCKELHSQFIQKGIEHQINQIGSMFTLFFCKDSVQNLEEAKKSDTQKFASYFQKMLKNGVYLAPSQFESLFISTQIGPKEIDFFLEASRQSLN